MRTRHEVLEELNRTLGICVLDTNGPSVIVDDYVPMAKVPRFCELLAELREIWLAEHTPVSLGGEIQLELG